MPHTRATQRDRILKALSTGGERGVLNIDLNDICLRYSARIYELRRMGYLIKREACSGGIHRYVLVGRLAMVA